MSASYFPDRIKSPTSATSPIGSPGPSLTPSINTPKLGALQSRIASVLSASYADLDIRDTLETLDARNVRNTAETRRDLRLDVQQELIECNGEVVRDFGKVAEQLRRVGTAIDDLNKSCAAIRAHVVAARRETAPMLEEGSAMTAQNRQTEVKQKLLDAFKAHFLLSDAELTALTSTAEPIGDSFFEALNRVKKIHNDSQVLLGSEDQQLGLEILEQSSQNLNVGFQKLFRWTQRELKTIDLENPQLSNLVRRGLRVLAERPQLFQSCLDFFAENREHTLSDAFYAALTGSSASANAPCTAPSRAIELNAHEPLRYVSDMLAWAHAATVGEREALQILFISDADEISKSLKAGHESQPWLQEASDEAVEVFDGKRALNDLVDRDLSGIIRQLKQRIEQVIHSHENATLAYQISNLVAFYSSIFRTLLGAESSFDQALQPLTATAMEQFKNITRDHIANLHSDVTAAPPDLSPSDFLLEALESFKGLMKSYDTSQGGAMTNEKRILGFQPVLLEALDPYVNGCENMAKRMDALDGSVFVLNCFGAMRAVIKGPAYTAERVEDIDRNVNVVRQRLVGDMHGWFANESGMRYLIDKLAPYAEATAQEDLGKVARLKVLEHESLAETGQRLDAFLPTAMEDARSHIGRLIDKAEVRRICETAADLFTEEFEMVERLLMAVDEMHERDMKPRENDEDEGPLMLRDFFPRTSDEIKVLLS